jgi:hypothetical protein
MDKDASKANYYRFLHQVPPDLLLDNSAGKIARELWWMNQEFSPVEIISP